MTHRWVKCRLCDKTIVRCRCPGPVTSYSLCVDCQMTIQDKVEKLSTVELPANPDPSIREFKGEYRFLSNFHVCSEPITTYFPWTGPITAPTSEHLFMAAKTESHIEQVAILGAATPREAKSLGREATLLPNWEQIKYQVMHQVVAAKFHLEKEGELLYNTGGAFLMEGNNWNDTTWGIDLASGVGDNWLGAILMDVRGRIHNNLPPYARWDLQL